ncbi:MAG TPA: phytoene/squalene synthase family protein [Gemmatimonadaceae bacterium]|nr:phytoene/squalene synthase family protein [Gemmatimonadaceae bacterium]
MASAAPLLLSTPNTERTSVDDAAQCRQIVRTHARTFWLASHFLSPEKRRSAYALYAFCRVADDLVDLSASAPRSETALRLDEYRRALREALAGRPVGPVFRELHRAVTLHGVPSAVLHELLEGLAVDCAPSHYTTWPELYRYCEGVASTVGEMCTHVFGVTGGDEVRRRALTHARILGVAMQLTNILRDVGEDARKGRCYLPEVDLAQFDLTRDDVLRGLRPTDPRWRALMAFEIARARSLYASAMPGIALLAPDSQRCATACAVGYSGILGAIEAIGYDTFGTRARLGLGARAAVAWSVWRTPVARDTPEKVPTRRPQTDGPKVTWA